MLDAGDAKLLRVCGVVVSVASVLVDVRHDRTGVAFASVSSRHVIRVEVHFSFVGDSCSALLFEWIPKFKWVFVACTNEASAAANAADATAVADKLVIFDVPYKSL